MIRRRERMPRHKYKEWSFFWQNARKSKIYWTKELSIYKIVASMFLLVIVFNTNQAMSHHGPRLPEPMVFDLVLPLGAKQHEYGLNALAQYNFADNVVEHNPEIEYVFTDGYAIELELPMENTAVKEFKVALQGTFNFFHSNKFIHGW